MRSRSGSSPSAPSSRPKAELAKAITYSLKRWTALTRFLNDGRLCMTNNAAERALRGVAIGRANWTFAGSDRGAQRAAAIYTLTETCKLNGVDPQAWLARRPRPTTRPPRATHRRPDAMELDDAPPRSSRVATQIHQRKAASGGLHRMPTLILGIDTFLDMGRSATNVIGNSLAAAVVAKWEGQLVSDAESGIMVDDMEPVAA